MKLSKILSLFFLLGSVSFYGQQESMKNKKQQIHALKIAFLTSELDLSPKEANQFWPVYNAFDQQQFEIRHQKMKVCKNEINATALNKLSEKEALLLLDKIESSEEELYRLRKKYQTDLKQILPAIKILKLKKSEEDFNRKLLRQYRAKK
ncbi:sensor of ECF-type sigma factor [Flavobacterium crassostreae]|uniref:Sensor of ECF-type sigma factor n=1 Tax=Flavobacterium crassostreae TaxID=1763534 RepID=A0A1B9E0R0_9FLAO|nr:sensor of ECF-type sigma factor [Flavobacterium crassostreae]OCB75526.1 sensor of ECF-type sigma factor [Flavobacterium crassostreae]